MMKVEDIARICHQVNKAYCEALDDLSQVDWEQAPEWQKQSAISGVNFHLANPDSTPSDSHEEWMKIKEADGWMYGEVKDADKKTHPCFTYYRNLPVSQRAKDYIFLTIVRELEGYLP